MHITTINKKKTLKLNNMSEKKVDKAKAAKKLHQLQKKLNRSNENESWLKRKIKEIREHKLLQILKYKTKK